jgi:molybdenum cofactor biosynthesis protein MoaC
LPELESEKIDNLSSHLDSHGHPVMVDVSAKNATPREALAEGFVLLTDKVAEAVARHQVAKGDVLKVAELAGIMAAKRTSELVPLCHPIRLDSVRVECSLEGSGLGKRVRIRAFVKAGEVTGVEMEALTAVSVAALTIYDMCKGIDKGMSVEGVRLLRKSGGKSGEYVYEKGNPLEEEKSVGKDLHDLHGLRAAVLTVSDKGARGERKDTAGPALSGLLKAAGAQVVHTAVVPDEINDISDLVRLWADDAHLVLTTGGTGLSERDVTPEALTRIADRTVPGLGELMRAESLKHTPNAPLSRGLAVTLGRCLVVAMPGSEKGARQCFEAIRPTLRHAVGILNGWDADCAEAASA